MNPSTDIFCVFPINGVLYKFDHPRFALAFYKDRQLDLMTGEVSPSSMELLQKRLDSVPLGSHFKVPRIVHVFYEWGHFYQGDSSVIGADTLLAIDMEFSKVVKFNPSYLPASLVFQKELTPSLDSYQEAFAEGKRHLLRGNCYQYNLTMPFEYILNDTACANQVQNLVRAYWREDNLRGHFSSATYVARLGRLWMSNTPECLFQVYDRRGGLEIVSMPIKGSLPLDSRKQLQERWRQLAACKKNQAELYMIIDLLCNDLSRIGRPWAKVIKKKAPLMVPGLLHQYALISVLADRKTTLGQVLQAIFPGGSVTGTPKKRVMSLLNLLEGRERGFYCGSTILLYRKARAASINIRSFSWRTRQRWLTLQAGGGVTLGSSPLGEYREMCLKAKSTLYPLASIPKN